MSQCANIVLIGLSGAGKTSCAEILARMTGYSLVDTDEIIQAQTGRSVAEIFAQSGEEHFRLLEREVIQNFLSAKPPLTDTVVSVGGGLPTYSDNIDLLKAIGFTVFLNTDPRTLAGRVAVDKEAKSGLRPLLGDGFKEGDDTVEEKIEKICQRLTTQLANRLKYYSQANLTVDTKNKSQEEVCSEIQTILINHPLRARAL